jgi:hypothetical protein
VPSAGHYSYQGEYQVTMKIHYAVVYGFTEAGAKELSERVNKGEECWNTGREIWLCKTFVAHEGAEDLLRARVESLVAGKKLTLGALRGAPGLVSQGDETAEYSVPQKATFDGRSFDSYRFVNVQGLWTVRLGAAPSIAQFNLRADGGLEMPLQIPVTLSREAFDVYVVFADFRRM